MHLCYLDESGSPELSGNTDHFVLLGLVIPDLAWKAKDAQITSIKGRYELDDVEIHTAWMARDYPEQATVPGFESLGRLERKRAVLGVRALNLAKTGKRSRAKSLIANYKKTEPYVHLTRKERQSCLEELATLVGSWGDACLFADVCSKQHAPAHQDNFHFAFAQVVTRFNTYLRRAKTGNELGLLIQDNNPTEAGRLTDAMRKFHSEGTLWDQIDRVIETPFFVNSELTSMIQLADLCAYATRRFFDNGEARLFDLIRPRFDRRGNVLVGLRHFTARYRCQCAICIEHGRA